MIRFIRRHPAVFGVVLVLGVFVAKPALGAFLMVVLMAIWLARRRRSMPPTRKPAKPQPQPKSRPLPVEPPRSSWFNRGRSVQTSSAPTPPAFIPIHSGVALPALGDVLTLTPAQFEETTRDLLTAIGFQNMTRCGGSGDLGVDIKGSDRQGRSVVVQCKRFAPGAQVGTPLIQSFIGMMTVHHKAERGIYVTTVGYSLPAVNLAQAHSVTLIDGTGLLLLLGLTGVLNGSTSPTMAQERSYPLAAMMRPVASNGAVAVTSPRFCTSCGAAIEPGAHFCDTCGRSITGTVAELQA